MFDEMQVQNETEDYAKNIINFYQSCMNLSKSVLGMAKGGVFLKPLTTSRNPLYSRPKNINSF